MVRRRSSRTRSPTLRKPLRLVSLQRLDGGQLLALEVGELQVLEHDVDELVERDLGLVVVDAGLLAGLAGLRPTGPVLAFGDDVAALGVLGRAFAHTRLVVAVEESILFDAADRDLDHAVAGAADDRLLGDDVGDVLANRGSNLLAVPKAIGRATIRDGLPLRPEDGAHGRRPQSFQRLLAAYLSTVSTQVGQ